MGPLDYSRTSLIHSQFSRLPHSRPPVLSSFQPLGSFLFFTFFQIILFFISQFFEKRINEVLLYYLNSIAQPDCLLFSFAEFYLEKTTKCLLYFPAYSPRPVYRPTCRLHTGQRLPMPIVGTACVQKVDSHKVKCLRLHRAGSSATAPAPCRSRALVYSLKVQISVEKGNIFLSLYLVPSLHLKYSHAKHILANACFISSQKKKSCFMHKSPLAHTRPLTKYLSLLLL